MSCQKVRTDRLSKRQTSLDRPSPLGQIVMGSSWVDQVNSVSTTELVWAVELDVYSSRSSWWGQADSLGWNSHIKPFGRVSRVGSIGLLGYFL